MSLQTEQPEHGQCATELQSSAAVQDPLSLLASASASIIGDGGQSSSSSLQDSPKSPLHKMAAENDDSPQSQLSSLHYGNESTDNLQQLDAKILSQMVTASMPGDAAEKTSIRVASMQEFRKASRNSLSGLHVKVKAAGNASPRTSFSMVSNPVGGKSDNPLLKLLEQRMAEQKPSATAAAHTNSSQAACLTKKTPAMVPMTNEQKLALDASINKWSGIGSRAAAMSNTVHKLSSSTSNLRTVDEKSASKPSPKLAPSASQSDILRRLSNNDDGTSKSRKPLDPSQERLIHELIQTQHPSTDNATPQSPSQPAKVRSSAQDFVAQVMLQQQLQKQQELSQLHLRAMGMHAPLLQGGMNRSAVSISELNRLRSMNQSVQMQHQIALQERRSQQCLLQHQRQTSLGNVRLSSSALPNSMMMRKRRSSTTTNDEDTFLSSHSPSLSSNTSSSKIHRSDSHSYVSSSMENLRLSRSRPSRLNIPNQLHSLSGLNAIRNQSFSSSLGIQNSSVSSSLYTQNQRFSTGSALGSSVRRSPSKAAMKRSTSSSSSWIQSMISSQHTAGKAAASAAHQLSALASNKEQHQLHKLVLSNASTSTPVKESDDSAKNAPIQVTAEEYTAPPIERGTSETVILSELPDRIKFQDEQVDKSPIEVVKEALSSRGEDANIKPTMDMPDDFFGIYEEIYIKEAVDAIRSSDVDALRQLVAAGKNLQCGNRFGESLIHLACRRSHHDVVTFLIKEAGVSIKLRDDYGRTPMHDACWRSEVDLQLMDLLIDTCPELLMLSDKRGHTPLDYARREHWDVLIPYLMKKKDSFRPLN